MGIYESAQEAYNQAVERRETAWQAVEQLTADDSTEVRDTKFATYDAAQAEVDARENEVKRVKRIQEARERTPLVAPANTDEQKPAGRHARANGEQKVEPTYRPDRMGSMSFFRDMLERNHGDTAAADRLNRNKEEALDAYKEKFGIDYRDMSNTSTAGAEFLPTTYLNDLWVHPSIAKRPFADAVPKYPLPGTGTTLSLPKLSSGVTVAGRSDAGAVSETDGVTANVTHTVNEIAGQVDIGRIAVYRSDPGLDAVIGQTLVRRYHAYLDTQLLSGTGTPPQHVGLRVVTSPNTTTYTAATPTQGGLLAKIYSAISDIATNRIEEEADTIVMHPRRAAWMASGLSSTFPLFQQGGLYQAAGTQNNGFEEEFAGLRIIRDVNVGALYGASTNEDEVYVLAINDFFLAEGPLMSRVFEDVGSGNGLIRFQVFAYSAFLSNRYAKSLSIISGTGLAAPSF